MIEWPCIPIRRLFCLYWRQPTGRPPQNWAEGIILRAYGFGGTSAASPYARRCGRLPAECRQGHHRRFSDAGSGTIDAGEHRRQLSPIRKSPSTNQGSIWEMRLRRWVEAAVPVMWNPQEHAVVTVPATQPFRTLSMPPHPATPLKFLRVPAAQALNLNTGQKYYVTGRLGRCLYRSNICYEPSLP